MVTVLREVDSTSVAVAAKTAINDVQADIQRLHLLCPISWDLLKITSELSEKCSCRVASRNPGTLTVSIFARLLRPSFARGEAMPLGVGLDISCDYDSELRHGAPIFFPTTLGSDRVIYSSARPYTHSAVSERIGPHQLRPASSRFARLACCFRCGRAIGSVGRIGKMRAISRA